MRFLLITSLVLFPFSVLANNQNHPPRCCDESPQHGHHWQGEHHEQHEHHRIRFPNKWPCDGNVCYNWDPLPTQPKKH